MCLGSSIPIGFIWEVPDSVGRCSPFTNHRMDNRSLSGIFQVCSYLRSDATVFITDGRTDRHSSNATVLIKLTYPPWGGNKKKNIGVEFLTIYIAICRSYNKVHNKRLLQPLRTSHKMTSKLSFYWLAKDAKLCLVHNIQRFFSVKILSH